MTESEIRGECNRALPSVELARWKSEFGGEILEESTNASNNCAELHNKVKRRLDLFFRLLRGMPQHERLLIELCEAAQQRHMNYKKKTRVLLAPECHTSQLTDDL